MRRSLPILQALRRAADEWRLVLLLATLQLLPALLATVPFAAFFGAALGAAPHGDRFLERLDLPLLDDLIETNLALFRALGPAFAAVAAAALLANALFAGGALETLLRPDPRPLALRFARGGGRYFGRFLRMGLATPPLAALAGLLLSAPVWAVRAALSFRAEAAKFWLTLAGVALAALGVVVVLLALDLARVAVARDDAPRAVRILLRSTLSVVCRPLRPLALWAGLAAALVAAATLLSALRSEIGVASGGALLASFVLLQLVIAVRALYRVALWSGEIALLERRPAGRG